jgi:DNA repair protein RadC
VNPSNKSPALHKIPIYEVRLVQARRALRLAEPCIGNSQVAARALHGLIGLTDREHFACLFVDGHHNVTGAHIAAIGGQHCIAAVDVRVILRTALAACATAMIVGHNHPSGDPTPSEQDITTTAAIMRAAKTVGIPVVDHVIVTRVALRYHSMLDRRTLPTLD